MLKVRAHWGCVSFKLTAEQVLFFHWIAGSSQAITLGKKEGAHAEAEFWHKYLYLCHVVDFPSFPSLCNRLLESPLCTVHVISAIQVTLIIGMVS